MTGLGFFWEVVILLAIFGFLLLVWKLLIAASELDERKKGSESLEWNLISKNAKYSDKAPQGRIAIIPSESKVYIRGFSGEVKSKYFKNGSFKYSDLRSVSHSENSAYLFLKLKNIDDPEWIVGLGSKLVSKWEEILLQEVFEK